MQFQLKANAWGQVNVRPREMGDDIGQQNVIKDMVYVGFGFEGDTKTMGKEFREDSKQDQGVEAHSRLS